MDKSLLVRKALSVIERVKTMCGQDDIHHYRVDITILTFWRRMIVFGDCVDNAHSLIYTSSNLESYNSALAVPEELISM